MINIFISGGQGSFQLGMGKASYNKFYVFRNSIDLMSDLTSEDIPSLCWGPRRTRVKNDPYLSHIAIWAGSYAVFQTLQSFGINPDLLMGHSFGEIISYCLSGAIPIEQACKLISYRGQLFAENKQKEKGDMIAVLGEAEDIMDFFVSYPFQGEIYPANYNNERQMVFAVANNQMEDFYIKSKKHNLRTVNLKIGNGCHSPLVEEIHGPLIDFIDTIIVKDPMFPILSCIDSEIVKTANHIKQSLKNHLLSPVKWSASLDFLNKELNEPFRFTDLSFSNTTKGLILGWDKKVTINKGENLFS